MKNRIFYSCLLSTLLTLLLVFIIFPAESGALGSNDLHTSNNKTYYIGHRGSSGSAPHNSLLAIDKAIKSGLDAVALDPRLTSDGKLVLCHDEMTGKVLKKNYYIDRTSYKKLMAVRYRKSKSFGYKDVRLTTLDEAVKKIKKYNRKNPKKKIDLYIKLSPLTETKRKYGMSDKQVAQRKMKTYREILLCLKKNKFPMNRVVFWSFGIDDLDGM